MPPRGCAPPALRACMRALTRACMHACIVCQILARTPTLHVRCTTHTAQRMTPASSAALAARQSARLSTCAAPLPRRRHWRQWDWRSCMLPQAPSLLQNVPAFTVNRPAGARRLQGAAGSCAVPTRGAPAAGLAGANVGVGAAHGAVPLFYITSHDLTGPRSGRGRRPGCPVGFTCAIRASSGATPPVAAARPGGANLAAHSSHVRITRPGDLQTSLLQTPPPASLAAPLRAPWASWRLASP